MPDDPRQELAELASALRAHVELAAAAGATGLPAATAELAESRRSVADGASPPEPPPERSSSPPAPASEPGPAPEPPRPPPSASRGEPGERLVALQDEVRSCTRCRLHETRKNTVFARGSGSSGVCFIGEGPGADEDAQGLPFVGPAGQLLDRMIGAMGLVRDEVYVCNIVKCRPPKNRKPEPDETEACMPYLAEQLDLLEPQVIVLLGATAVEGLLGVKGGITRLRGTWRLYRGRTPVMPTFHPAYLLRNERAKRDVWMDLQEVMKQIGRPVPSRK